MSALLLEHWDACCLCLLAPWWSPCSFPAVVPEGCCSSGGHTCIQLQAEGQEEAAAPLVLIHQPDVSSCGHLGLPGPCQHIVVFWWLCAQLNPGDSVSVLMLLRGQQIWLQMARSTTISTGFPTQQNPEFVQKKRHRGRAQLCSRRF